mmetsp:Transcript_19630/g.49058  ORF Transcript_19630/g.49058 Transcript_19630/m.49058 type:complete len:230 (+) Transcript_19630:626-1315(+)
MGHLLGNRLGAFLGLLVGNFAGQRLGSFMGSLWRGLGRHLGQQQKQRRCRQWCGWWSWHGERAWLGQSSCVLFTTAGRACPQRHRRMWRRCRCGRATTELAGFTAAATLHVLLLQFPAAGPSAELDSSTRLDRWLSRSGTSGCGCGIRKVYPALLRSGRVCHFCEGCVGGKQQRTRLWHRPRTHRATASGQFFDHDTPARVLGLTVAAAAGPVSRVGLGVVPCCAGLRL